MIFFPGWSGDRISGRAMAVTTIGRGGGETSGVLFRGKNGNDASGIGRFRRRRPEIKPVLTHCPRRFTLETPKRVPATVWSIINPDGPTVPGDEIFMAWHAN